MKAARMPRVPQRQAAASIPMSSITYWAFITSQHVDDDDASLHRIYIFTLPVVKATYSLLLARIIGL